MREVAVEGLGGGGSTISEGDNAREDAEMDRALGHSPSPQPSWIPVSTRGAGEPS